MWGNAGGGYKRRYPLTWEAEVVKTLRTQGHICVTEVMDHVVRVSKAAYAGTPAYDRFLIYHDGLSQWYEKEAQEYLHRVHNFRDRQLRCYGDTNKDNSYYRDKVVGDSPEITRGLDTHGFADLKLFVNRMVALSSMYPQEDHRRFNMGTPLEVERSLRRAWEMVPTSARIIEDIEAFPRVLRTILAARGCVVRDEFLRTGRRYHRASDVEGVETPLKKKPRRSQRLATHEKPLIHPDCQEAYNMILASGGTDDSIESVANTVPYLDLEL